MWASKFVYGRFLYTTSFAGLPNNILGMIVGFLDIKAVGRLEIAAKVVRDSVYFD